MIEEKYYKELAECIEYKEGVPYWKKSRLYNRAKIGDEAGHICKRSGYRFIGISINNKTKVIRSARLHWYIYYKQFPGKSLIDHINRDRSDDRIDNLRLVTASQNSRNVIKRKNSSSKYYGVSWDKTRDKWKVQIRIDGKSKHIGYFKNEVVAAKAYDKATIANSLQEYSNLNFSV